MNKRNVFASLALGVIVLFFSACVSNEVADSDKVSQDEIYQTYRVTVDAAQQTVTGFASFRFGGASGTTLRLTAGSNVIWNDTEMPLEENIFMGAFYERGEKAELQSLHTFVFTDTGQKTYTNTVELMPAEPKDVPAEVNSSENTVISWVGQPLRQGEKMVCSLRDSSFTSTVSIDLAGATSIQITPEDWNKTKKGLINISFERTYRQSLKEATHLGGSIEAKYISNSYPVIVK